MNLSKLIHNTFPFLLVFMIALVSCSESSADDNPNPKPGSGDNSEPVETDISSIHTLNTEQGYINSHSNEWENSSVEMDYRSSMTLGEPILSAANAQYPRIKKMKNGSFLLIYQQGPTAHDIYYARSNNLVSWQNSDKQLFEKTDMKQYNSNVDDRVLYSSADAIVLDNGDILAFASFRLNKGYLLNNLNNGIMMRRSSDNGNTWSDTTVIYRGTTWEPSGIQLSSKEVHLYFTSADPNKGDSGTALLRSTDAGNTWTHVGKVIRQHAGVATDGSSESIFTDQMPVAIQLNNSERIAVAFESRFGRTGTSEDKYHLGLAYSNDNWTSGGLVGEEEGPADRQSNLFLNEAAPYLRQFRSGETILSSGISKMFNMRVGDSDASKFGEPMQAFPDKGAWGSIEIIDDHTLIGAFPAITSTVIEGVTTSTARIQLAKFVLNHRINATKFTPKVVGSNKEWKSIKDAFFIGSVSQAQASFRFAYDDNYLYCLVERLDKNLSETDAIELMVQSGNTTGNPYVFKITPNATTGTLVCDKAEIYMGASVLGTFDNVENDQGYVIEIAIPRDKINVVMDRILFNAVLYDTNGDDSFSGLTASNYNKWLPVELKEPSEPQVEPEPGDNDNGVGPQWNNGEETNPW